MEYGVLARWTRNIGIVDGIGNGEVQLCEWVKADGEFSEATGKIEPGKKNRHGCWIRQEKHRCFVGCGHRVDAKNDVHARTGYVHLMTKTVK